MKTIRLMFSDDMARAVVQGRKTVTRRPVIDAAGCCPPGDAAFFEYHRSVPAACFSVPSFKPGVHWSARMPCAPGDLLIGRECVSFIAHGPKYGCRAKYRADGAERVFDPAPNEDLKYRPVDGWKCIPSIHMPDRAARIRRRVISVTVERVQDITEDDAVREGFGMSVVENYSTTARDNFSAAWESIYAANALGWDANPWVWRIEFSAENVEGEK